MNWNYSTIHRYSNYETKSININKFMNIFSFLPSHFLLWYGYSIYFSYSNDLQSICVDYFFHFSTYSLNIAYFNKLNHFILIENSLSIHNHKIFFCYCSLNSSTFLNEVLNSLHQLLYLNLF